MKVGACALTLILLLATIEPDGCTERELSVKDQKLLIHHHSGTKSRRESGPPFASSRRVATKVLYSKVSRTALHYGLEWSSWQKQHNRSYLSSREELERYVVWRSNTAYIQSHNSYADKFGFTLAMNKYGDLVR